MTIPLVKNIYVSLFLFIIGLEGVGVPSYMWDDLKLRFNLG